MNEMKPHSASQNSYEVRKLIMSVIDKPMRFIDIQQAVHARQSNKEKTRNAHISNHLTKLCQVGCLNVKDTKAKSQDRFWYTLTGIDYTPTVFKPEEVKCEKTKAFSIQDGETTEQAQLRVDNERAQAEFSHKSAMRQIPDLAKKLREQSRLMREDRNRMLIRQRIGCGISQVYSIG
jgi:hypothetical protein